MANTDSLAQAETLPPLSRGDMLLAVLPMLILAAYATAIYVVNVAVPLTDVDKMAASMTEFVQKQISFSGLGGNYTGAPILYWSPLLGVIAVVIPLVIAAAQLLRRQPIPVWLLPALGMALSVVLTAIPTDLGYPITQLLWLMTVGGAAGALLLLHRQHRLPILALGALIGVVLLEIQTAAEVLPVHAASGPQRNALSYFLYAVGVAPLPRTLVWLVAATAWLAKTHGERSVLVLSAPLILLADYALAHGPDGIDDQPIRTALAADSLIWAGLYILWSILIAVMMRARKPQQLVRLPLVGVALLAIITAVLRHTGYPLLFFTPIDAGGLFQLGFGVVAGGAAVMSVTHPTVPEAVEDNPVGRWVLSQRMRDVPRAARFLTVVAFVLVLLCVLSTGIAIATSSGNNRTFAFSFVGSLLLIFAFVGQILVPTFLAMEVTRRLVPLVNSDVFVMVLITTQGPQRIVDGLDQAWHKRLRRLLMGYGFLLALLGPGFYDYLSIFHGFNNQSFEFSVAVRVGLFGLALMAIRVGELAALLVRNSAEARFAAGFVMLVCTLLLMGLPLPDSMTGVPYIGMLVLLAFGPYVINGRLRQAVTRLIATRPPLHFFRYTLPL